MLPIAKLFLAHQSSQQTVNIHSSNALHAKKVCIAYAPQESTGVQNVSVIILPVPKTIFQHKAELSCSKRPKMVCQCSSITSEPKIISVTTLGLF